MAQLINLPPEIIEEILLHLDPIHVASVAQCSSLFRCLVYGNEDQTLWRELYLEQAFDNPRICVSLQGSRRVEINWREELQRIIRARTVLHNISLCRPGERLAILHTLLELVTSVPPLSSSENVSNLSRNIFWVATTLREGAFLDQIEPNASVEELQLYARLHTYFGLTKFDAKRVIRLRSRAFVYDMRNYQRANQYGPFDYQGCVNWVHIQAIHHLVSMHIVDLREDELFSFTIFPMSLPFTQIIVPPGTNPDEEEDWAGVAGAWRVSFCFCDHHELLRYNESAVSDTGALDVSIFEAPDFGEVFRSLDVNIRMVKTKPDPAHPKRPIISFIGDMPDTSATMIGHVKMTPDNQIQWQFVSGDQGNAVWSSQGVHIGGLRSSFGVLGSWTTVFHDADDPVGPFWLRRQSATVGMPMNHISQNS